MKQRKRRSPFYCMICISSLLSLSLPGYFLHRISKSTLNKSIFFQLDEEKFIPDIFDLSSWRLILIGGQGNQSLCDVPVQYRSIANAFCHAQGRADCPKVPCTMISISKEYNQTIYCLRGGKQGNQSRFDWLCRKSPALELFSLSSERKPSILAEAYTTLTYELYGQALSPYHDGKTGKWGLTLEAESVGYYPSIVQNHRLLSLFDLTLGYDRRYFDLITDRRLPIYYHRITHQRLTIEEVLTKKNRSIAWI